MAIESKMLINSVMYTIAVSLVAKRVQKDKEYQLSKVVTAWWYRSWIIKDVSKTKLLGRNVALHTSLHTKDQLNSRWIYEVIVSPKMPTKDFCPRSLLEGGIEILVMFGWHFDFGWNDDFMNSFWI